MRTIVAAILVALCATSVVFARSHRHTPKRTVPAVTTRTDNAIPAEKNRHPADVVLDRKIKDICRGC
jgi:hypothetical protein